MARGAQSLSAVLVAVTIFGRHRAEGASSKMDYLPFANVRTDPVIIQGGLSDHVHTFYGAVLNPRPDITYNDMRAACTTSGNVEENKSLYWHPSIYKVSSDGTKTLAPIYFATAYYIWKTGADTTQSFKQGFQMIADQLDTNGNEDPKSRVVFTCDGASECERADGCTAGPHQTQAAVTAQKTFPTQACSELEIKLVFPTCSDGRLDSPNHRDHVAYDDRSNCGPNDEFTNSLCGVCPTSHPIKLLEIQFYFRILGYEGGHYVFSNGRGTVHSDYVSGWEETRLQQVLDECPNDSEAANPTAWCEKNNDNPNGLTFRDLPKQKGDKRIRCMLDQIQATPAVDTSTITTERISNLQTLPSGANTGTLLPAGASATPATCPTTMTVATECGTPADDWVPPPVEFCTTAGCNAVYGRGASGTGNTNGGNTDGGNTDGSDSGGSDSGGLIIGIAVAGGVVALLSVGGLLVYTGVISIGGAPVTPTGAELAGQAGKEVAAVPGQTPGKVYTKGPGVDGV